MLIVLMGRGLLRRRISLGRLGIAAMSSAVLFFVVTNFGSWLSFDTFPPTLSGLASCYIAGIPFFKGTLLGDVLYSAVLFGGYALAQRRWSWLREPTQVSTL